MTDKTDHPVKAIFAIIAEDTYTLSQLQKRLGFLREQMTRQFFGASPAKTAYTPPEERDWLQIVSKQLESHVTKENIYQIFAQLEADVKNTSHLVIMLPFLLPPAQTSALGKWLREQFNASIFFEPKLDSNLIAGCALIWKGVYKDFSLRQKVEDQRQTIFADFGQYLK